MRSGPIRGLSFKQSGMPIIYPNPLAMLAELQVQQNKKRHLRDIAEAIDVEYEEIYEQPNNHDDENNQTMVD